MDIIDHARVIIYRVNKKGLEVFLVNSKEKGWKVPQGVLDQCRGCELTDNDEVIELDPVANENGATHRVYAIEGEWHEIPSIRGVIKEDVRIVKDHLKQKFPDLEQGTYFAVKEAIKKVMPEEYSILKELKDVMLDRNQAKYI